MVERKRFIVFSLVFLSLFLLSINLISAEVAGCRITTRSQCVGTEVPVLGLSALTNAHGQLGSQSGYNNVLCCEAYGKVGSTQCDDPVDPTNAILKLSSSTNAHAQLKTETGYNINVCFDTISCTTGTSSGCPSGYYPIETVSLSGTTNAHIGSFNSYPLKICCGSGGSPGPQCGNGLLELPDEECDDGNYANYDGCSVTCQEEPGYECINTGEGSCCYSKDPVTTWAQSGFGVFSGGEINIGDQLIVYISESFCMQPYTPIDIVIYKKKVGADILVTHVDGQVSADLGKTIAGYWTISASDLSALGDGDSNIYFILTNPQNGDIIQSDTVQVSVQEGYCGDGVRNGDEQCDGSDLGGATCPSGYTGTPSCYPTGSANECTLDTSSCTLISTETCDSLGWECDEVNGEVCGSCGSGYECQAGYCVPIGADCSISSASWGATSAIEGDSVQLNVQTSNCIGQTMSFVVKEKDGIGNPDDDVTYPPSAKQVTSDAVTQSWTAEYQDDTDGGQTNPPEYEFTATIGSESKTSSNELGVLESDSGQCLGIDFCSKYTTESECEDDICKVGGEGLVQLDCGYGMDCICVWDGDSCEDATVPWETCDGDGIINIGEQCDGDDWGPVPKGADLGCQYFGYAGGTLTCNGCVFDTSQCNGKTIGECGNNVINTGEQCDNNVLSLYNCSSLDSFTNIGGLFCNDYCLLDTRNCEGGEESYVPAGGYCQYVDSLDDDCEDGYLTRNLTAMWVGEGTGDCESPGATTIQCPAQIKVRAFGVVQFVIAIILLIIIYIIIKSRIEAMQKKKGKRKKGSRTKSLASSSKNRERKSSKKRR